MTPQDGLLTTEAAGKAKGFGIKIKSDLKCADRCAAAAEKAW